MEIFCLRSFWKFLDDLGTKYWWMFLKFGMLVVDMGVSMIYIPFFPFSKKMGFIKVFQQYLFFEIFGVNNSQFWNLEIAIL